MIEKMASLAKARTASYEDERSIERAISAALSEIKAIELDNKASSPLAGRWNVHQRQVSIDVLSAIPGIGTKKAESLVNTFTTLSGVFSASVDELSVCENVGSASALKIFETLHG